MQEGITNQPQQSRFLFLFNYNNLASHFLFGVSLKSGVQIINVFTIIFSILQLFTLNSTLINNLINLLQIIVMLIASICLIYSTTSNKTIYATIGVIIYQIVLLLNILQYTVISFIILVKFNIMKFMVYILILIIVVMINVYWIWILFSYKENSKFGRYILNSSSRRQQKSDQENNNTNLPQSTKNNELQNTNK